MNLRLICQRPQTGSRWYRGNFTLGLAIDIHPRFVNVILCLLVVEIGIGWKAKPGPSRISETGNFNELLTLVKQSGACTFNGTIDLDNRQ